MIGGGGREENLRLCRAEFARWLLPHQPGLLRRVLSLSPLLPSLLLPFLSRLLPHVGSVLRPEDETLSPKLASGILFFYLCLAVALCAGENPTERLTERISDLFSFVLLYILSDFYLDDPSLKDKDKITGEMTRLFLLASTGRYEEEKETETPPPLRTLASTLQGLLRDHPERLPGLLPIFSAQMGSVTIQSRSDLPRSVYLDLCRRKGSDTYRALAVLLGEDIGAEEFPIGVAVQLVDDMFDLETDLRDGISTVATFDFAATGNLDELFLLLLRTLTSVPPPFLLVRLILLHAAAYLLTRPGRYSPELVAALPRGIFVWEEMGNFSEFLGDRAVSLLFSLSGEEASSPESN